MGEWMGRQYSPIQAEREWTPTDSGVKIPNVPTK